MESIVEKGLKWPEEMRHWGAELLSRENLEFLERALRQAAGLEKTARPVFFP